MRRDNVATCRNGFRERGALDHLSVWASHGYDLLGRLSEKCESMPFSCVV